ncbi:MAG: tetratricopeptide repeat protein [Thiotrichaceae bacterium]
MTIKEIDSILKQASNALDSGNSDEAAGLYKSVLNKAPDNHEACLMLGSLYGESGRLPEAVEFLQQAIELKQDDVAAGLVLARIYQATGDSGQAIKLLERISQSEEDAEVTYTLATLEEEGGNWQRAQDLFGRAVELDPDNAEVWMAMASFHMNSGEFDKAETFYNEVLKREPNNNFAIGFLSVALAQQERTDEAESLLREALQTNVDNPDLHYYLAHTLKQQGLNTEALESCERALASLPEDRRFIVKKAEIYEGIGDLEQAFDLLKPILESGDVPVDAALIFARLSHPLGMVDDGKSLLHKLSEQPLTLLHKQNVSEALQWLESV